MYCTISDRPSSRTELSVDARRSLSELAFHARTLGALSASFGEQSLVVMDAYRQALLDGDPAGWRSFVNAASEIAKHGTEVEPYLTLDKREQTACAFFSDIARENSDLIVASERYAIA